eukprot:538910-Pleurochrysis_carterae.AAC.2
MRADSWQSQESARSEALGACRAGTTRCYPYAPTRDVSPASYIDCGARPRSGPVPARPTTPKGLWWVGRTSSRSSARTVATLT